MIESDRTPLSAVLLDLDGVIYQGDRLIPGARETIGWLHDEGVPHLFVTNTTSRPRRALVDKLAGLGVAAGEHEILTPPMAAHRWLDANRCGPVALFVPTATSEEFAGVDRLAAGAESGASAVVVGDLGKGWDFAVLNRAFRLLMANPRAELIALGMTRYWRAPDGLRLDTGPFVAALEMATGRRARVFGKPAEAFFAAALDMLGARAAVTVMVGDDIRADVAGAQAVGMIGVLVRTGKFTATDLQQDISPDAVLDSVAELPQWWRSRARR